MDLLNTSQLTSMSAGAHAHFLGILDNFLHSSRESLTRLAALEPGQLGPATEIAHQLRGASGTLGLQQLHLFAKDCEQGLKGGLPLTPDQHHSLQSLLESSVAAARDYLAEPPSPD